jgi:hypothetical protein
MCAMKILLIGLSLSVAAQVVEAQSPTPIVVQATSTVSAASTLPVPAVQDSHSVEAAITLLEQMKAANDEILSKQKAALERLEEMQQAAGELKIFAARG